MELSGAKYNNLAKTPELRKGPEYQGPKMDKDLHYYDPEMEKDLQYQGSVESKTFKQDKKIEDKGKYNCKTRRAKNIFYLPETWVSHGSNYSRSLLHPKLVFFC